jgi:hypothetical protein
MYIYTRINAPIQSIDLIYVYTRDTMKSERPNRTRLK